VEAIARLVYAYAERLDRGDLDGVAELFRFATWRTTQRADVLRGVEQVRRAYHGIVLYDGVPGTLHVITNLDVKCAPEADVATSRCYFTVLQARPGSGPRPTGSSSPISSATCPST
jgi:hypothetical protein